MQVGPSREEGPQPPLPKHERAHLALVGEMMVLPLGSWVRDALEEDDPADIADAEQALLEKLPYVNDVIAKLGRRPLDMATLRSEPVRVRLRIAIIHLATEVIAGR